jgi:hypothetical protein
MQYTRFDTGHHMFCFDLEMGSILHGGRFHSCSKLFERVGFHAKKTQTREEFDVIKTAFVIAPVDTSYVTLYSKTDGRSLRTVPANGFVRSSTLSSTSENFYSFNALSRKQRTYQHAGQLKI